MKLELVLKQCPWCKKTPEIFMPIPDDATWVWYIQCDSKDCCMKPKTHHVSIRKTSKKSFYEIYNKLEDLAHRWNHGNPSLACGMKLIDLEKLPEINEQAKSLIGMLEWSARIMVGI